MLHRDLLLALVELVHEVVYLRLVCLHHHQRIEVAALILSPAIELHDIFELLYLCLSLLVVKDEEGAPVILIRVFEKSSLFFVSLSLFLTNKHMQQCLPYLLLDLFDLNACSNFFRYLHLFNRRSTFTQKAFDEFRHECSQNDGGETDHN